MYLPTDTHTNTPHTLTHTQTFLAGYPLILALHLGPQIVVNINATRVLLCLCATDNTHTHTYIHN